MPVSGNYGTPTNPYGDIYSSYWELEWYSGSDPAHVQGDEWGRSDLAPGDSIATIRVDHYQGGGVWDIPVFPTSLDPNSSSIKKFDRVETPNGRGWIPWLESGGAFNNIGTYHNGTRHGIHDALSAIPDSAVLQLQMDEGSGTTLSDSIGSGDATLTGSWDIDASAVGGWRVLLDGTGDNVAVPYQGFMDNTQFSVATTFTPQALNNGERVFDYFSGGSYGWNLASYGGNLQFQQIRNNSSESTGDSSQVLNVGTRLRLCLVYNGGDVTVYSDASTVFDPSPFGGVFDPPGGNLEFWIGANQQGGGELHTFADNTIWYDAALAASGVQQDYDAQPWS